MLFVDVVEGMTFRYKSHGSRTWTTCKTMLKYTMKQTFDRTMIIWECINQHFTVNQLVLVMKFKLYIFEIGLCVYVCVFTYYYTYENKSTRNINC